MHSGAHSWLFPIAFGLATLASAYSALTGRRIGWGFMMNNPGYNRFAGLCGVAIGLIAITWWFVTA